MRQDGVRGCHWAVVGSSRQQVDLAAQFYAAGAKCIVTDVARRLQAARDAVSLVLPDDQPSADHSVRLFLGLDHRQSVPVVHTRSEWQGRALVRWKVDFILRACGTFR